MQKLAILFGFLALTATACGDGEGTKNYYYNTVAAPGTGGSTSADISTTGSASAPSTPATSPQAGSAGISTTVDAGNDQTTDAGNDAADGATNAPPAACKVTANNILGDGYAPRIAVNDDGYAVLWFGPPYNNLPYFQSFDWNGKPLCEKTVLLNAIDIIGGKDDYLVEFEMQSLTTVDSFVVYGADGNTKQPAISDMYSHRPFLSFDGNYYRLTWLYAGCDAQGSTGLTTGRISANGNFVQDISSCISRSGNYTYISGVVEQSGKLPLISVFDAGTGGHAEIGSALVLMDLAANLSQVALTKGSGLVSGNAYDVVPSNLGPMLRWTANSGDSFVSVINKTQPTQSYGLPKGMSPTLVDNDRIVDIMRDQLSGQDTFIRATTQGVEIDRQNIESAPIDVQCYRGIYGRNGHYVNTGSPCLPSNGVPVQVFVRLLQCN